MIHFFKSFDNNIFAVKSKSNLSKNNLKKLEWLFGDSAYVPSKKINEKYIGLRASMISPWSTNAVDICINMGISEIERIEEYIFFENYTKDFDPMLNEKFDFLDQNLFNVNSEVKPIIEIENINDYNISEGLSLSADEINFLENVSKQINRKLTDSEVFGFSQVNSEHCRHKIFNGKFIINDIEKKSSLFSMIKKTSKFNSKYLVSAYKDNVAFINGPKILQFSPKNSSKSDFYHLKEIDTVISLKAETHNFPTTVEPFNGAATGSGGEIRDRLAGGKGSIPLAGTAVYMTPYSRINNKKWEKNLKK